MTKGQTIKALTQPRAASQASWREKNPKAVPAKSSKFDDGLVNVSCQSLCQRGENGAAANCRFTGESGVLCGGGIGGGAVGVGWGGCKEAMAEHRAGGSRGTLDSVAIHVHSRLA